MKPQKSECCEFANKGKTVRQTSATSTKRVPRQNTIDIPTSEKPTTSNVTVKERRASLKKTVALKSGDMLAVQLDPEEVSMLKSMQKSNYSSYKSQVSREDSRKGRGILLHHHEYEDFSEESEGDEDSLAQSQKSEEKQRKMSASAIHKMEWRQRGMRHEKMRSNTKSKELIEEKQVPGSLKY
ncbi:hypothetical protein WR25_26596 isoform C [Diploscapter pachys]|uniref:Uncharacterized protein n=1 Tax=Diploscapter pachys TaxID=2018661 RepID=A0A2A2LMZ7_9BILA|nr:hypothetical protein WR25_26596 isoform C [Diploscapter pachys]